MAAWFALSPLMVAVRKDAEDSAKDFDFKVSIPDGSGCTVVYQGRKPRQRHHEI